MSFAWRNFQKHSCGISTYDNRNFKPQISSIFHFDWVGDGRMAHVLGVNYSQCLSYLEYIKLGAITRKCEQNFYSSQCQNQ